jgi:hypothetical protein
MTPITLLPRDVVHHGKWFTQMYRAGGVVMLENSQPGVAYGHKFHVFEIDVVDGREQLGLSLGILDNLDTAISMAAKIN